MAAFRECYSHLHELRSLAPKVPMIALTATATKLTKDTILNVLFMDDPYESLNKLNLTYVVECMSKDTDLEFCFGWLIDELKIKKVSCQRTIIYCQTIKQCGVVYGTIKGILGQNMYVLVEMLHSCTPAANKQNIYHSFQSEGGSIRDCNYCFWDGGGLQRSSQNCALWTIQNNGSICPRDRTSWKRWRTKHCIYFVPWDSLKPRRRGDEIIC